MHSPLLFAASDREVREVCVILLGVCQSIYKLLSRCSSSHGERHGALWATMGEIEMSAEEVVVKPRGKTRQLIPVRAPRQIFDFQNHRHLPEAMKSDVTSTSLWLIHLNGSHQLSAIKLFVCYSSGTVLQRLTRLTNFLQLKTDISGSQSLPADT